MEPDDDDDQAFHVYLQQQEDAGGFVPEEGEEEEDERLWDLELSDEEEQPPPQAVVSLPPTFPLQHDGQQERFQVQTGKDDDSYGLLSSSDEEEEEVDDEEDGTRTGLASLSATEAEGDGDGDDEMEEDSEEDEEEDRAEGEGYYAGYDGWGGEGREEELVRLLHQAARQGDTAQLENLMACAEQQAGADCGGLLEQPDEDDIDQRTVLLTAAAAGKAETVQWLLEQGADAHATDILNRGLVELAIEADAFDVLVALYSHDKREFTRLFPHYGRARPSLVTLCVVANALACLERLLQDQARCASIDDLRDIDDRPLLISAIRRRFYRAALRLLNAGADPHVCESRGRMACDVMIQQRHELDDDPEQEAKEKLLDALLHARALTPASSPLASPVSTPRTLGESDSDELKEDEMSSDSTDATNKLAGMKSNGHRPPTPMHVSSPDAHDREQPPHTSHLYSGWQQRDPYSMDYHPTSSSPTRPLAGDSSGGIGGLQPFRTRLNTYDDDGLHAASSSQQQGPGRYVPPGRRGRGQSGGMEEGPRLPPMKVDAYQRTKIHEACMNGDVGLLEATLQNRYTAALRRHGRYYQQQRRPWTEQEFGAAHAFARAAVDAELTRQEAVFGDTPLIRAARWGHAALVVRLLHYTDLPFLVPPPPAPKPVPVIPLDKYGHRPPEPLVLSLPLFHPDWSRPQHHAVRAALEIRDQEKMTALMQAVKNGREFVAVKLLEAGADPTAPVPRSRLLSNFDGGPREESLVEVARAKGLHGLRWKLEAALQEPQRLYYLLKLRHIYESGQLPFTPPAGDDGRTDDEVALCCSVFAHRRATTPRDVRLRLPRLAIAPPNTLFDDDEEDEDSGGRSRRRSSSPCPYTLDRPRACLDFAVLRLPPSSFLRLVEMLDPGEWWPHALPPVPTPTPAAGLSAAPTTVGKEEELEWEAEDEDSKKGKGRAKLIPLEEMRRKKEVERWMEAEAKHAKRLAGEDDTGKEGKEKAATGGRAAMGARTRWGPGISSSSSSSAATAAEAEEAASVTVRMDYAWKKDEPIVVEKE